MCCHRAKEVSQWILTFAYSDCKTFNFLLDFYLPTLSQSAVQPQLLENQALFQYRRNDGTKNNQKDANRAPHVLMHPAEHQHLQIFTHNGEKNQPCAPSKIVHKFSSPVLQGAFYAFVALQLAYWIRHKTRHTCIEIITQIHVATQTAYFAVNRGYILYSREHG